MEVGGYVAANPIGRGKIFELQARNENQGSVLFLSMRVSADLANQLRDLALGRGLHKVKMTCTILKQQENKQQIIDVSRIDILDMNGKVLQTIKDGS